MPHLDVLSWDFREQPDLDHLARALAAHGVRLYQVATGSDDYAIVITEHDLTPDEVDEAWERS